MTDTSVVVTGYDRSAQAFESLNNSLAKSEERFKSAQAGVKGFVGAFGIAFLAMQINKSLEFADAIDLVSRKTGLTTKATQELQYAFIQNGSDGERYNAVMTKFVQTLGEAADGSRTAVDALNKVGISQEDLKRKSVEELYIQTSDALAGMTSEAKRASTANDIFAKTWKDSAQAIALSRDELISLRGEANAVGAVLDEQVIRNAKKTKDEMEQWSRVISVQLSEAFVNIAPILVKATQSLAEVSKMVGDIAKQFGLIDAISLDDKYDVILKKRMSLMDEINTIQERSNQTLAQKWNQGTLAWGLFGRDSALPQRQKELADLDRQLAEIQKKYNDRQTLEKSGNGPGTAAAVSSVKAPSNTAEENAFADTVERMRKAASESQAAILTDEREKALQRIAIAQNEFEQKVGYSKLTVEQKKQFDDAFVSYQQAQLAAADVRTAEANAKEMAAINNAATEKFEKLQQQYDDEYALKQSQQEQFDALDDYYKTFQLERDERYWQLHGQIEEQGLSASAKRLKAGLRANSSMWQAAYKGDLSSISGVLGQVSELTNSHNKKQFEAGKKAAMAKVMVDTFVSAQSGFATSPFFPVGLAMGALALAIGYMNYKNVSSLQFQGGGGGGGGAVPSAPSISGGDNGQGRDVGIGDNLPEKQNVPKRNVTVVLQGDGAPSDNYIRNILIPGLKEAIGDGVTLTPA